MGEEISIEQLALDVYLHMADGPKPPKSKRQQASKSH